MFQLRALKNNYLGILFDLLALPCWLFTLYESLVWSKANVNLFQVIHFSLMRSPYYIHPVF